MSRLLLLEDEIEIGANLYQVLQQEGYEVEWAKSGDEAVFLASQQDFDLMILDVMLKTGTITNGMEVARVITKTKKLPYMLLTSRSDSFDIMIALDMGAEDYITKPYDLSVLLARIRAILRRIDAKATPQQTVITYNDISLNLSNHAVKVAEKPVQLSNQLFQLLHFLIQNKRSIVTKEQLYRSIWGYEPSEVMDTNTLEVNIRRLRAEIGSKRIKTVRGRGYILE